MNGVRDKSDLESMNPIILIGRIPMHNRLVGNTTIKKTKTIMVDVLEYYPMYTEKQLHFNFVYYAIYYITLYCYQYVTRVCGV